MSHTAIAPTSLPLGQRRPNLEAVTQAVYEVPLQVVDREVKRWLRLLIPPFVVAAICFGVAVGTGTLWLIGLTMLFGAGFMIFSFIYLMLSSNSNGE